MVQQENIHSGRSNSQLGGRSRCSRYNLTRLLIHALSRSGSNPATVNFKTGQVEGQHAIDRRAAGREAAKGHRLAPVLLGFPPHGRRRWIFDLDPVAGPARAVRRTEPLGHDALAAELARVVKDDIAFNVEVPIVSYAPPASWRAGRYGRRCRRRQSGPRRRRPGRWRRSRSSPYG
jgi:hypothetical protein